MRKRFAAGAIVTITLTGGLAAQTKKVAKGVMYDVTITAADANVYTGTAEMAIEKGKVSGEMLIKSPTEITATVSGTAEAGVLKLDFPYRMTQQQCVGNVKMEITVPPKTGPLKGTMEAVGCGRDETQKLTGAVEMKPVVEKK